MTTVNKKFLHDNGKHFLYVDAWAYTGNTFPDTHEKSNIFLNIETGKYYVFDNNSWGEPLDASGKNFLSVNSFNIFHVMDGNIYSTLPENFSLYWAELNSCMLVSYIKYITKI